MLTIDGSTLEGGGQLTRLALCLSAITSTPVRIHSIRAGRSAFGRKNHGTSHKSRASGSNHRSTGHDKRSSRDQYSSRGGGASAGGLKDSHLAALKFLSEHCRAIVEGAQVGSTEVVFRPCKVRDVAWFELRSGRREFAIGLVKPGSVWLIFQAVFPFLLFCTDWSRGPGTGKEADDADDTITLILKGGTNVSKAMSTEYITQVFLPVAARIGLPNISVQTVKRGWAGNAPDIGEVRITIHRPPRKSLSPSGRFIMPPFSLTHRGEITKIDVSVIADPPATRTTLIDTLTPILSTTFPSTTIHSHLNEASGDARRLYILLVAHTSTGHVLGADYLGGGGRTHSSVEAKRKLDEACSAVVTLLQREIRRGGCVDMHMQDQLVVFQALAVGGSKVDGGSHGAGMGEKRAERNGVEEGDVDEDGNEIDAAKVESVGDDSGTLHTRTVRWVCERMLEGYGVGFEAGGVCRGVGWNDESCRKTTGNDDLLDLDLDE